MQLAFALYALMELGAVLVLCALCFSLVIIRHWCRRWLDALAFLCADLAS